MCENHFATKSQRLTDKGAEFFAMHEVDNTAAKCVCVFVRERGREEESSFT